MTGTLHDDLTALAASAPVRPPDTAWLVRRARRQQARAVAAVAVALFLLAGAGTAAAIVWRGETQTLRPADDGPARGPAVPSEESLSRAVSRTVPGGRVTRAKEFPAGYLPPGTTAFDDRNRLGRVTATVELPGGPGGPGISVAWDLLDRPLDANEIERFVAYRLEHDDTAPDPEQTVLRSEDDGLSGLRLWRVVEHDRSGTQTPSLVLAGWAENGANVVLSRSTSTARADEPQETAALIALARDLLGPEPPPLPSPPPGEAGRVAAGLFAPPPTRIAETDDFGRISDVMVGADGETYLRVERVDMLTGAAGEAAAKKDGMDYSNDYYLRSRPEFWLRYRLDLSVAVWGSIRMSRSVEPVRSDLARLVEFIDKDVASREALFHLDVEDGAVVGVEEQYRP